MEIDCGLNERIIHQFVEISALTPAVRKLILFGSRASGNYKYNSDIDLAFQSSGQVSSHYYFKMEEAAELYKLDLLDMDLIKEDLLVSRFKRVSYCSSERTKETADVQGYVRSTMLP